MKPAAVLVVELDGASQSLAAPFVAAHGLALHVAGAPGDALRCAAERDYEVILISVRGPVEERREFLARVARLRPRTPLLLQIDPDSQRATGASVPGSVFAVFPGPLAGEWFGSCLDAALEDRKARQREAADVSPSVSKAPISGQPKEMNMYPLSNQQMPERRDPSPVHHPGVGLAPTYSEPSPIGHTDPLEILALVAERGVRLRDLQDRYIDAVLSMTSGNKVRAARILGIDRKTLYRRAERRTRRDTAS